MSHPAPGSDRRALLKDALQTIDALRARLDALERARTEPIAIVGLGCRFPGGVDTPERFWDLLHHGRDAVTEVPRSRWPADAYARVDPEAAATMPAQYGGFLDRVAEFDPDFFGISPREALMMDPQHRLVLEVCWEALEDAAIAPDRLRGSLAGVFVGITTSEYMQHLRTVAASRLDLHFATGNAHNGAAGRVSYLLGLHGPSVAVDTACSSSLTAIHLACQSLRLGEANLALAGGVNTLLLADPFVCFYKWGVTVPDGRCRAFDEAAGGFSRAEGCGIVVLKRLSDALADGDRVLAVIRGSAVNQDGASGGLTVPNGRAQEMVIRRALDSGRIDPASVDYVEAHGTGTPLGDPIELEALDAVYGVGRPADRPLVVGSVKTNIGHAESAAGVASLIKAVLALQHGEIPPHLHFKTLTPKATLRRLKVAVATSPRRWITDGRPRLAAVSSFGLSGTNAHLVVEEAPPPADCAATTPDRPRHVLTLTARSEQALASLAERWAAALLRHPANLADAAFTANTGRARLPHRVAIIAGSAETAAASLSSGVPSGDVSIVRGVVDPTSTPRAAFFFSECGPDAAASLYDIHPPFRASVNRCETVAGMAIGSLVRHRGPAAADDDPAARAAASFAIAYGVAELLQSWGIRPVAVAGCGAGEYVAACVAGLLRIEDALPLAIAGARVAAGAHGAAEELDRCLDRTVWSPPSIPLIASDTGASGDHRMRTPAYWRRRGSASLEACIRGVSIHGCTLVFDIGQNAPSPASEPQIRVLSAFRRGSEAWHALLESVATLYCEGLDVDWVAFDRPFNRSRIAMPTYPFERQRYWIEAPAAPAERDPPRWLYDLTWKPAARTGAAGTTTGPRGIVLFADDEVAARVAGEFGHLGVETLQVRAATEYRRDSRRIDIDPTRLEHYERLWREVASVWPNASVAVSHLWGVGEPSMARSALALAEAQAVRAEALLYIARSLPDRLGAAAPRLSVVTRGAQAIGAADAGLALENAPLWGAGRVISLDRPDIGCTLIDLDPCADLSVQTRQLVDELAAPDGEDQIALRAGARLALRLVPAGSSVGGGASCSPDATYLITGGYGGIGLRLASWLVDRGARHLVLVGRRGLPERATWDDIAPGTTLHEQVHAVRVLERAGATVRTLAVDVADRDQMARLFEEIGRALPPLKGVIHAAGVIATTDVREMTVADLRDVFGPKVRGGWILHELTQSLDLDFFVLFSSGAAVWGSRGLAHYAGANHFLDALAHHRRRLGLPALSINWGPWSGVGMGAGVESGHRWLAQMGMRPLAPEDALAALGGLLGSDRVSVIVADVDWKTFAPVYSAKLDRRLLRELAGTGDAMTAAPPIVDLPLVRELREAVPGDRRAILVTRLQAIVAAVLGREATAPPDPRQGLTAMGMDSLMVVDLRNRLQKAVGRSLPSTLAFDYPSIQAIADFLLDEILDEVPAAGPALAPMLPDDVAEVAAMSDDDVKRIVAGELDMLATLVAFREDVE